MSTPKLHTSLAVEYFLKQIKCLMKNRQLIHVLNFMLLLKLYASFCHLRSCPLNRNLSSLRHIIVTVRQVSGHPKIGNLHYLFLILQKLLFQSLILQKLPWMSFCHPPGCSWQQGLCVQSSSWTGTPYLRQSDNSTPAAVEVAMVETAFLD